MKDYFADAREAQEKATTGRALYEATRVFGRLYVTGKILLEGNPYDREWDELSWDEQDHWEARADELNESRRPTP